ncbi:MAG: hypothetical protein IH804_08875 [Planctomycetes bacterium]|nr:hypothetical protein [Planctomycetota bacterium]
MRPIRFAALLGLAAALSGCARWATHPPIESTERSGGPSVEPIPSLMADAIRFAHNHYRGHDEVIINLPEGTPAAVYEMVTDRLGSGRPMMASSERAYHVTEVRVRGLDAQVDLLSPRKDGYYHFVTISFRQDLLRGYQVAHTRLWRIREEPPAPNYRSPPPRPEAAAVVEIPES